MTQEEVVAPAPVQPTKSDVAKLFDMLAQRDVDEVVVMFSGGWDYNEEDDDGRTAFNKGGEVVDLEEVFREDDFKFVDKTIRHIWRDVARTMGYGYDRYRRYDAGEFYQGTDDEDPGEVIFNVAEREIRLEAIAKVRVVEYRSDKVSRTWDVKDDRHHWRDDEDE
jgi:hypothetical protein